MKINDYLKEKTKTLTSEEREERYGEKIEEE